MAARTARKVASSMPRAMRSRRPSPSTSSGPASRVPDSWLTSAKPAGPWAGFRLVPGGRPSSSLCRHQ
jgi:hypothetical protein